MNNQLLLVLFIWHILVFPSSNGYNSYQDQDEGPIGGLASPPKPTKLLLYLSNILDVTAVLLSFLLNFSFAFFVAVYIIVSRLYSNRSVRLKRMPVIGFLVVVFFQGAWVFGANVFALDKINLFSNQAVIYSAIACTFFIGTIYPITQIYQHEADQQDGVKTLSMLLGKMGTFVFSGMMFLLATLFVYFSFYSLNNINNFWLFNIIMLPATVYFLSWGVRSFNNRAKINFKNTMIMLVLSALLNNLFFLILLIK